MRSSQFIILALFLAACNESVSEADRPPPPITVQINAPESMYKDDLKPITIHLQHPDGLQGTVRYVIDGEESFNKQLSTSRWDTTFTPTLPAGSQDLDSDSWSQLSYDVQSRSENPVSARSSQSIPLQESQWYQGELPLKDVFGQASVSSGAVTLQGNNTVLAIQNNAAIIPREARVAKEDLREGIEYLVQANGFIPSRGVTTLNQELQEAKLIPEQAENFDFKTYKELVLQEQQKPDETGHFQKTGNYIIWAYPKNTEIDLNVIDQGVFQRVDGVLQLIETTNELLFPSKGYISDVLLMRDLTAPFLEELANITFNTYIQSEVEKDFPIGFPTGTMTIGSWNNGPYDISQNTSETFGKINWTYMLQKVTADNGPRFEKWFGGTCFDFLQSVLGTPENPRILCGDEGLTSLAKPVFQVNYSFSPDDGWYNNLELTGANGETVTQAWVVN